MDPWNMDRSKAMPYNLPDAYIGCLTTRHIVLQDDDGKEVGQIRSTKQGPGIWLTAPDGSVICLIALTDMTAMAIYDKAPAVGDRERGADLAFAMQDGEAVVQYRTDGGDIRTLKLADIKSHLDKPNVHETHTG